MATKEEKVAVETVTEDEDDGDEEKAAAKETTDEESVDESKEAKGDFIRTAREDILRGQRERASEQGEPLPAEDTSDLVGKTFINDPDEDEVQLRARIIEIKATEDYNNNQEQLHKFRCQVGDKVFEEVTTYNKMLDWVNRDADKDDMHKLDGIMKHRKIAGSKGDSPAHWEVLVKWASGKATWEPAKQIHDDDAITMSLYAKANGLIDKPGWRQMRRDLKNNKKVARLINQRRLKNFSN